MKEGKGKVKDRSRKEGGFKRKKQSPAKSINDYVITAYYHAILPHTVCVIANPRRTLLLQILYMHFYSIPTPKGSISSKLP